MTKSAASPPVGEGGAIDLLRQSASQEARDGFRVVSASVDGRQVVDSAGVRFRQGTYVAVGGRWSVSGDFMLDDRGIVLTSYKLEELPPSFVEPHQPIEAGWSAPASPLSARSVAHGISSIALATFPPGKVRSAIHRELVLSDAWALATGGERGERLPDTEIRPVRRGRPRQWLDVDQRKLAQRATELGMDGVRGVRRRLAAEFGVEERTIASRLNTLRKRGYLAPGRSGHSQFLPGPLLATGSTEEDQT